MLKIKVCGMKYPDNISGVAELQPDYMGFIFYPGSSRYCEGFISPELLKDLPAGILKTGVFVNETIAGVTDTINRYSLDVVQLHGNEPYDYCAAIKSAGVTVIKAFPIAEGFNFNTLSPYKKHCDYFLFDTKTGLYGGSGLPFDRSILYSYDNEIPFILSGGISPEDCLMISNLKGLNIHAVDINSRFETEPGRKDVAVVGEFIRQLRAGGNVDMVTEELDIF